MSKQKDPAWTKYGRVLVPRTFAESLARQRREEELHRSAAAVERVTSPASPPETSFQKRPPGRTPPKHKLFDLALTRKALSQYGKGGDSEERHRLERVDHHMLHGTEYRELAPLPLNFSQRVSALKVRFPNFERVLNYVESQVALAEKRVLRLDPILLNGAPGIGKSLFAQELAEAMGAPIQIMRMENAQANSELAGSSDFWSNSRPGMLFTSLFFGAYANPIFFLDEIDKVGQDLKYNPISTLYSLLEPTSASRFSDLSYPWFTLDASRVAFICTSNDTAPLSPPILSRLRRFDIPSPTAMQAREIVLQIAADLKRKWPGRAKHMILTHRALRELRLMPPRRVRLVLKEAAGYALQQGEYEIDQPHIRAALDGVTEQRTIGFI